MRWLGLLELTALLTLLSACGESGHATGAPCDGATAHQYYPDADGDGFAGSMEAITLQACGPPVGYVEGYSADCDDADAAAFRLAYRDLDGDGYSSPEQSFCIGAEVPPDAIVSPKGFDCDDADALVFQRFAPDLDGDGYVGSTDTVCAARAPDGYRPFGQSAADCDDADGELHPGAWESFGDGVDVDCDGEDDPRVCTTEARALLEAPIDRDWCGQADLRLVGATLCRPCHGGAGQIVLRTLNQGSEPSEKTTLEIQIDGEPAADVLVPALDPGEGSPPLALVAVTSVQATLLVSDCDGSNDAVVAMVETESCTR